MGYTAFEKMRENNLRTLGVDYPIVPEPHDAEENSLKRCVIKFIRDDCQGLRFQDEAKYENVDDYYGKSVRPKQIPLHLEYDIDRLCLERALSRFLETGLAQDAFDVYICYMEMFLGGHKGCRKMVEMLSDFEMNTNNIMASHRDHYVHSVYVFSIGLGIFQQSQYIRGVYEDYYNLSGEKAAHHFLKYWGLTALFHDMGYPYELAFEEVKNIFGDLGSKKNASVPYVSFKGIDKFKPSIKAQAALLKSDELHKLKRKGISPIKVFAVNLTEKLYEKYKDAPEYTSWLDKKRTNDSDSYYRFIVEKLEQKASSPEEYKMYMDHAFFSALLLINKLAEILGPQGLNNCYCDALTAILLHNSLYKYTITDVNSGYNEGRQFEPETHPLAYLLLLCDDLQCWNRRAYGQLTKLEHHPCNCDLKLNGDKITVQYFFDCDISELPESKTFQHVKMNKDRKLDFQESIEQVVKINNGGGLSLEVCPPKRNTNPSPKGYLSNSGIIHFYKLAVALNAQYKSRHYGSTRYNNITDDKAEDAFGQVSLEYKLSNIAQAKRFAKYLDELGCFYSDRVLSYDTVLEFTDEELSKIGEMEHKRWVDEKTDMGWMSYDPSAVQKDYLRGSNRERIRIHDCIGKPYADLCENSQKNDKFPIVVLTRVLKETGALHIYSLPDKRSDKD